MPHSFVSPVSIQIQLCQIWLIYGLFPIGLSSSIWWYDLALVWRSGIFAVLLLLVVLFAAIWHKVWSKIAVLEYSAKQGWFYLDVAQNTLQSLECTTTGFPNILTVVSIRYQDVQFPYFIWHGRLTTLQRRSLSLLHAQKKSTNSVLP